MTREQMGKLAPGQTVRMRSKNQIFLVSANYGDWVVVVRTIDVSNPREWIKRGMPLSSVSDLKAGDRIQNTGSDNVYVVTSTRGNHATGVWTEEIFDPDDWSIMRDHATRNSAVCS